MSPGAWSCRGSCSNRQRAADTQSNRSITIRSDRPCLRHGGGVVADEDWLEGEGFSWAHGRGWSTSWSHSLQAWGLWLRAWVCWHRDFSCRPRWRAIQSRASRLTADKGDDDYGQIWADEDDGSTSDDLRGIRSDVYIVTGAQCQRISSVTVQSPSRNGEFEFGFIRGWWGPSACDGVDHDHFYTQPTLFDVQIQDGSGYDCKFWPNKHPTEEQYDLFRSSDINGNSYWGCYWDGEELQPNGVDMDFSRGHGVVNMERGSPNDGGHAEFLDIEEYHDGNGWTYIESPSVEFDGDPDFVMDFPTNHSANVHD